MAHTHEFDCRQCGAHLDSREELDRHNREQHGMKAGSSTSGAPGVKSSNTGSSPGNTPRGD